MYLSFSGRKKSKCLFAYWHVYINFTPHPKADDRLGSIYGSSIGKVFEDFYTLKLWRVPGTRKILEDRVPAAVDQYLAEAVQPQKGKPGGILLWRGEGEGKNPEGLYGDRDELVRDVEYSIGVGLRSIKEARLVGNDAVAEMKLDTTIEGHRFGGRADFILTRVEFRDKVIIDGKGSRRRDKYVDVDQLKWYAMLYRAKYGVLPDRTGFLYWKFEPPVSMDWHEFTTQEIDAFQHEVVSQTQKLEELVKQIEKIPNPTLPRVWEVFKPKATEDNCMFCPYANPTICPKGAKKRADVERKLAERRGR